MNGLRVRAPISLIGLLMFVNLTALSRQNAVSLKLQAGAGPKLLERPVGLENLTAFSFRPRRETRAIALFLFALVAQI